MEQCNSPHIENIIWGQVTIEGQGKYKDAKLYPGGAREWDWRETGTHHIPGIQPTDIQELLDHGANVVVLSRGMLKALQTCKQTLELLSERNIPYYVLETREAVQKYNELRETDAVGGLFHSTC